MRMAGYAKLNKQKRRRDVLADRGTPTAKQFLKFNTHFAEVSLSMRKLGHYQQRVTGKVADAITANMLKITN